MALFTFNAEDPEALQALVNQAFDRLAAERKALQAQVADTAQVFANQLARAVAVLERLEKKLDGMALVLQMGDGK